jgi:RNA polymerase sigma factor (sigma-70 family)
MNFFSRLNPKTDRVNTQFVTYTHLVERVLKRYQHLATDAEIKDLRQEGFLFVWEFVYNSTSVPENLESLIKSHMRRTRRYQNRLYGLIEKQKQLGIKVSELPDLKIAELDLHGKILNNALNKIEPKQAEVLRRFHGIKRQPMKISEIAADLGITRQAVRALRKRGYQELWNDPELQSLLPHRFAS